MDLTLNPIFMDQETDSSSWSPNRERVISTMDQSTRAASSTTTENLTESGSMEIPTIPLSTHGVTTTGQTGPIDGTQTGRFRLSAAHLSLTYPQCGISRESALTLLKQKVQLDQAMVVQETHEDGSLHLHVYLHLKKRCNFKRPDCLDLHGEDGQVYHGNYQATKNVRDWITYLSKSDPFPLLENLDVEAIKAKKGGKFAVLAQAIIDGGTPATIMQDDPGSYLAHAHKIKSFFADWRQQQYASRPVPIGITFETDQGLYTGLVEWLRANILQQPRGRKSPGLYLYSAGPNTGKTTLIDQLRELIRVYEISPGEFDCNWDDDAYDLAVFEDWEGQRSFSWWKTFVEGVRMPLRKKGQADYIKMINVPVIITSNKLPRHVFKHLSTDAVLTWEERFTFIEATDFIQIRMTATDTTQRWPMPARIPFPEDYILPLPN